MGHPSTLVFDPGPPRCIASGVRWLKRAWPISGASRGVAPRFSNSQLTLHPLVGLVLALVAGTTFAQYPIKPVRVVVPYAAGGPVDEVARVMGPRLTEIWGQQVLVDNRVGAGGSIGTEVVAKVNHVPYKGAAPALVDLIAGHIEVTFANIAGTVPYARSGRVRAIAVSSSKRSAALPNVPTIAETYPGYDLVTWMGIFVPAGTSRAIIGKLQGDFVKVVQRPDIRERFESQGTEVVAGSGEDLAALIDRETKLYAGIIKATGMQPQ